MKELLHDLWTANQGFIALIVIWACFTAAAWLCDILRSK